MDPGIAYHPRIEYLLVALVALGVTFLTTALARLLAIRMKALALPRNRDVHAVATPRMGGVAMFAGLSAGLFVATRLPALRSSFSTGPDFRWIVASAALICLLGVIDDRYELDSLTKLCGQVLATGLMVTLGGVQLAEVYLPGGLGTVSLGSDLSIPITIGLTVLTINAINFIDGLDGLAAGVVAIAAGAFFLYSYHLAQQSFADLAAVPTLISAVLGGTCLGFLAHNFYPARIFMGDSGSMLVGLLLSAAATSANANTDPQVFHDGLGSIPLSLPLLIPVAVLILPFLDLLLAVVRRVRRRQSPFHADKEHLHHRLLELGHSHRRAVLLLYLWTMVLAIGGVSLTLWRWQYVLAVVLVLVLVATSLVSLRPRLRPNPPT